MFSDTVTTILVLVSGLVICLAWWLVSWGTGLGLLICFLAGNLVGWLLARDLVALS